MQKQEAENRKQIQAKFSALKQSRAKRVGKFEDDSESDDMGANDEMYHKYKAGRLSSSDDEDGVNKAARELNKDHTGKKSIKTDRKNTFLIKICLFTGEDSDTEINARRLQISRNRFRELCDEESSEGGVQMARGMEKKRKASRNSRCSGRIESDSSSDEDRERLHKPMEIKIKEEMKSDEETYKNVSSDPARPLVEAKSSNCAEQVVKVEDTATSGDVASPAKVKLEIEDPQYKPNQICDVSSDCDQLSQQSFLGQELKKKHRKRSKTHKSNEDLSKEESKNASLTSPISDFDDKKNPDHEKKHASKKEKKRDKSKEEYERSRLKKSKKLQGKDQVKKIDNNPLSKREDKMEHIFGPLSDESEHSGGQSSIENNKPPEFVKQAVNQQPSVLFDKILVNKDDSRQIKAPAMVSVFY